MNFERCSLKAEIKFNSVLSSCPILTQQTCLLASNSTLSKLTQLWNQLVSFDIQPQFCFRCLRDIFMDSPWDKIFLCRKRSDYILLMTPQSRGWMFRELWIFVHRPWIDYKGKESLWESFEANRTVNSPSTSLYWLSQCWFIYINWWALLKIKFRFACWVSGNFTI